ncbi:uncharacterized protein ACO6RY_18698 [Pungitius sinensis]
MVSWCSCLKGRLSQNPGMSNAVIRETGGDASTLRSHREQTEMDSSTKSIPMPGGRPQYGIPIPMTDKRASQVSHSS